MLRAGRQFALVAVIACTTFAWSQTVHYLVPASSVRDDFSTYHEALINAADAALSNVSNETETVTRADEPANDKTDRTDPAALHQFAEQYWSGDDKAVREAIERVGQLRPLVAPLLKGRGIPDELMGLLLVESAGQPMALSPKGARGIWQFMPDTARLYGLTVSEERDERIDVQKSTLAATLYLRDLYMQFGDWSLALAAYNAGTRVVKKAIVKGGTTDFERLSSRRLVPRETREYVPAVLSAATLLGGAGAMESGWTSIGKPSWILYAQSDARIRQ